MIIIPSNVLQISKDMAEKNQMSLMKRVYLIPYATIQISIKPDILADIM